MSAPTDKLPSEALRDRAVAWQVRLASDAAEEADWLAFEAWLAESPEHLAAYEAVERGWTELDGVGPSVDNVVRLKPRPSRRTLLWGAPIAAGLAAAVVVGVSLWPEQPATQSYATAFGERRVVALADGSRVTLNGDSRIAARLGRHERRVAMMAGAEAAFDVAKDPRRPFIIQAGDREIRVVGTEFNVLRHSGEVRVTVRRGVVEVRPAGQPDAGPPARLTPGQRLTHREGRPGDVVVAADPEVAFAWTQGRLIFQGEPLGDVAKTLNRYVTTPITVASDARDLPVTAVLVLGPEDQMLKSLAAFLPVQPERQADSVRLSRRRETR
jgi:transmembrane sensor